MKQGWELKKLGDIGNLYNGNSINENIKKDKYTGIESGLPFIATKDISFENKIDYNNGVKIPFNEINIFKIAPKNTVLICAEGGSAGRKIGYTNQDVCFGNKLFALTTNQNIDSRFIYYYYLSSSFQKDFTTELVGIIGGVSMSKFKELKIPIPPLSEQQKIVGALDKTFSAIEQAKENAEKNLKNVKELFNCYLQSVFEKANENWNEYNLIELCKNSKAITYGVIKLGDNVLDGIPCLRTSNVKWLHIDLSGVKSISPELSKEYSRTILNGGELLVNVRGTLGGVAVADTKMSGWNVSREVAVVPLDPLKANSNLLKFIVGSNKCQKWLNEVKKGVAYTGINIEDLKKLPIKIPNLEEQSILLNYIDDFHIKTKQLIECYLQKLNNLEEFKKSILQKAFNGDLC